MNYKNPFLELNITETRKQQAVLQIFAILGYFDKAKLLTDISNIGHIDDIAGVFAILTKNIQRAKPQFDPEILFNNLPCDQLPVDLLVYWGQNAFARDINQERSELNVHKNLTLINIEKLFQLSSMLGFIDSDITREKKFDEAWLLGTSRHEMRDRILDLKNAVINYNKIRLLTGDRILWAEIDGFANPNKQERLLEAKNYMQQLAQSYNIQPKGETSFIRYQANISSTVMENNTAIMPIKYKSKQGNIIANRTYFNNFDTPITETLMCYDLIKKYYPLLIPKIILSECNNNQDTRPTTESTLRILKNNVADYKNKRIYIQTNQPYVMRKKALIKLIFAEEAMFFVAGRSIGVMNNSCIKQVISEIGAWIAQLYYTNVDNIARIRKDNRLMYRIRKRK